MGWNGEQIKAFVNATVGKMEPMAVAAQVFANVSLGDFPRSTVGGNPTAGTWSAGELVIGYDEVMWLCLTAGTPGVWYSSSGSVYPTTTFQGKPADAVADLAALKAVTAAQREDKQVRLVEAVNKQFRFDSGSSLTGDDIYVVAPTAGTGRWIWLEESIAFTGVAYVAVNGKTAAQGADGSIEKPFSTVAAGLASLTSGGLLYLGPGTYTETAPLSSFVHNTVMAAMGGAVTITVAAGKVGVIGASRNVAIDGPITVAGIADSNALELADGGGGAATTLNLKNGATVTSLGTGHAIAVLGKGQVNVLDDKCVVSAGGTGNGINLAGATSNCVCRSPFVSGTVAINQASTSTVAFYGAAPTGCTFATPANVSYTPTTGFTKTVYVAKNGTTAAAGAKGTPEHPFSTFTEACAALSAGGTIMAAEGTYTEAASISPVSLTTIMALGGPVTITCATAVFTIAANRTLTLWGNVSVVGPNNLNAVELADGATTTLTLKNGAHVVSVGTGHAVAYAGQGIVINDRGLIEAGATGNGVNMFNAVGSSYVGIHSRVTRVGGLAINKPANADCIFRGCTAPEASTYTAGAGAVTVYESPVIPTYVHGSLPLATTVPAGTKIRCTDYPTTEGSDLVSNGTKWIVKDFQPKPTNVHGDAAEPITAALLLSSDTFDITAMTLPRIYTVDTGANIAAAMPELAVGSTIEFAVVNGSAQTGTIAVGAGGTLRGSGTVLAGTTARYRLKMTAAATYDLFRMAAEVPTAIVALAAGKTLVYGTAVIDPAAATDVVATGLATIEFGDAILRDAPLLAEVMWLTADWAAGNLTTSGWTCTGAGDTNPKVGVGKAAVGTRYAWWAIGTV